jgi:antitoxin PrlF
MKTIATVTSKGQITIPRTVRRMLGLHAGDALEFDLRKGRVEVRPARPGRTSAGILKTFLPKGRKPVSVEEMDAGIARHLSGKYRST